MANLETLTLEINGDARQASQGIDTLIGSLSALGQMVRSQISPLRDLATVLKDIKTSTAGGNILKGITPKATDAKKATSAIKEVQKAWAETHRIIPNQSTGFTGWGKGKTYTLDPTTGKYTKPWTPGEGVTRSTGIGAAEALGYKDPYAPINNKPVQRASEAFNGLTENTKGATASVSNYKKEMDTSAKVTDKATNSNDKLAESTMEVSKASVTARATVKTTSHGILSQIGRIAKTMLIRTAIRSLMKVASQGLKNYYEYSKSISGAFYTAVQSIQINASVTGNQIGAMLGSLLTSLAPILNGILTIVSAVAEAITMLFSLLGGSSTYSKATKGFDNVGKAAGGAGGKIKEMLASFDELNVIAQESGGGGGGGGGGFGFSFEELALPQWLIEWKPLIDALLAGTLGAIVLPKIFDWVKKIFGLGDGAGAKTIKDVVDKLLGKDNNKFKFDIDGMVKAIGELGTIKGELVLIEESLGRIKDLKVPDFAAAATEMGILAFAAGVAAPAIEKICSAIAGLKGGIGLFGIIGTILSSLAANIVGGKTLRYEIDKEPFEEFQKEVDALAEKELKIRINFDKAYYKNFMIVANALDEWAETPYLKEVLINFQAAYYKNFVTVVEAWEKWAKKAYIKEVIITFQAAYYNNFVTVARGFDAWADTNLVKKVNIVFDSDYLSTYYGMVAYLYTWGNTVIKKNVEIGFTDSLNTFNNEVNKINRWVAEKPRKVVSVETETSLFNKILEWIAQWLFEKATKTINIIFDAIEYAKYISTTLAVDLWASIVPTKTINIFVNTDNYKKNVAMVDEWVGRQSEKIIYILFNSGSVNAFNSMASQLATWASQSLTKTIYIETVEKGSKSTKSSNGSNGLSYDLGTGLSVNGKNFFSTIWEDTNNNIKKVLDSTFGNGKQAVSFGLYASGGFPQSGDLFIANDAGAEMIGTLGGRTTVANNEQIVEGIQRGIAEGNNEQNTLLRQQNELLRGILEKENIVKFGASVSFGRTVRQSLNMYDKVGG